MDPNTGHDDPRNDELGDIHSQFGTGTASQFPKRWKPIRGSYVDANYAPPGKYGAREFGSTVAFGAAIQPAIIWASYQIEQMAEASNPNVNGLATFGAAYASTFVTAIVMKILAGFLRNFGESLIRDLAAWLWINALRATWYTITDLFTGWIPWNRSRPFRPQPNNIAPRPGFWDRWRTRRQNRRQ